MKLYLKELTIFLFFTALFFNFLALFSSISNTLPLTILAVCYLFSFFSDEKPNFTWYHALFLLFIGYIYLHNVFIFPDEKTFAFRRKAFLAFMGGMAAFQLLKDRNMNFMYLMNLALPFAVVGMAMMIFSGYLDYENLFNKASRLILRTNHATTLGMMLCLCLVTGFHFLLGQRQGKPPSIVPRSSRYSAVIKFFHNAGRSKTLVSCGMLLSLVLLFPTFSKTAFFATIIVCGAFSAYQLCKRWGLLRCGAFFATLALCAIIAWEVAPIEQAQKNRYDNEILSKFFTPWEIPTFESRIPIWESSILATMENPLFGIGVNGFADYHQSRVRASYDQLVATYGKPLIDGDTIGISSAHSVFLLWFAETGILGGALFCLLFFTPLFYCLKHRTLCGEMSLVLLAFGFDFFFDEIMGGGKAASFCVTVVFMTFGYFSGIVGQEKIQKKRREV